MFLIENVRYKEILDIPLLEIPAARVTSIVGESGSGKTTLLRLLNKMQSPDSGRVSLNGTPLAELNSVELRRRVVMLQQAPAIFPGTIRDNLLLGLKFAEKKPVTDDRLCEILKLVRLNKKPDDDAGTLSGGEKQRLALGRVILLEPEVYLLDEPSSSLDEETEKIIIEQLVHLTRSTGKTLVMVTHSKQVALAYSDIIIEIRQGRVSSTGRQPHGLNN